MIAPRTLLTAGVPCAVPADKWALCFAEKGLLELMEKETAENTFLQSSIFLFVFSFWSFAFSMPRFLWREAVLCLWRQSLQDRQACWKHSYLNFQKQKNAALLLRLHCAQIYMTQGSVVARNYLLCANTIMCRECCTSLTAWAIPGCDSSKEFR